MKPRMSELLLTVHLQVLIFASIGSFSGGTTCSHCSGSRSSSSRVRTWWSGGPSANGSSPGTVVPPARGVSGQLYVTCLGCIRAALYHLSLSRQLCITCLGRIRPALCHLSGFCARVALCHLSGCVSRIALCHRLVFFFF